MPTATESYRECGLEFQDFTLAYAEPPGGAIKPPPVPSLISTGGQPPPGTQTVNYLNAPIPFRARGGCTDLAYVFESDCVQFTNANRSPQTTGDPLTPFLRTYENDKVEVRVLVGAHTFSHIFTLVCPKVHLAPS